MDNPGESQEPAVTAAIVAELDRLTELRDRHQQLLAGEAAAGSNAREDAVISEGLGHEVWDLATDQLASSLDHLRSWRLVITSGEQPTFSHLTLIRASMESAVTSRWLLDREASPMERVGRAAGLLWYDYDERRKAEHNLGAPPRFKPPAKPAAIRQSELEAERIADHVPRISWPGPTTLFHRFGDPKGVTSEALYRILSAHAHARRWRLLLSESKALRPFVGGSQLRVVTANDDLSATMTSLAVRWVATAMDDAAAYVGTAPPPRG